MEILVLSDSHGNTGKFKNIIDRHPKIEFVIHLGDYGIDVSRISDICGTVTTEAVRGNCDRESIFPLEKVLQLLGKRIFITHGHNYGVKSSLNSLVVKGKKEKANLILYGHTHIPKVEMLEGIWIVNPGSIARPKGLQKATYAIVELTIENINPRIVEI